MQLSNKLLTTTATWSLAIAAMTASVNPQTTPMIESDPIATPTILVAPSNIGNPACAIVSSMSAQFHSFNPRATTLPTVPIQDAYDCLQSVPIFQKDALAVIDGLTPYLQFQSTLAFLKNPPKTYALPGVDLIDGLQQVRTNVINKKYKGEHAFQLDLWDLLNSAHDAHLRWVGDTLQSALTFVVPYELVSVSGDGQASPSIYLLEDIRLPRGQNRLPYTPSPVKSINGRDAASALAQFSLDNRLQDPDALYNSVFFEIAQIPINRGQDGPPRFRYPGVSTTFVFANGTSRRYLHEATVVGDFTDVNTGNAFYTRFCNASQTDSRQAARLPALKLRKPLGYPAPVKIHSEHLIGGYYLNDTGFTDVAVLSVLGFAPSKLSGGQEFQKVLHDFITTAKAAGKTKLIVDVQANGGGITSLGYETFLQLFPNIEPFGASVSRAHDGLNFLGQGISNRVQNTSITTPGNSEALERVGASLSLNYAADVSVNGTAFSSWSEVYGPHEAYGDSFTSLTRSNLSDPLFALKEFPFINLTGRGNRVISPVPPFPAENVILLTDGFCSSTCAMLAEFLGTQAKVKSVTFGGRPDNKGPMQAVGGTKGTQVEAFGSIFRLIGVAAGLNSSGIRQIQEYIGQKLGATDLAKMSAYPILRSTSAFLNFKSNIRINDTTLTPLQFVNDAADCRLWYTPGMISDISEIWRAAAQVAWSNSSLCIGRGTDSPLSSSGSNKTTDSDSSSTASLPLSGTTYPSSFGTIIQTAGATSIGSADSPSSSGSTGINGYGPSVTGAAAAGITESASSLSNISASTDSGPSITSPPSAGTTSNSSSLSSIGQTIGYAPLNTSPTASANTNGAPTGTTDGGNITDPGPSSTISVPAGTTNSQSNLGSVDQTTISGPTMTGSTAPANGTNNSSIIPDSGGLTNSGSFATTPVATSTADTPSVTSDSGGTVALGPSATSSAGPMSSMTTASINGETNVTGPSVTTSLPPANTIDNPLPISVDGGSNTSGSTATTPVPSGSAGASSIMSDSVDANSPGPSTTNSSPPANITGNPSIMSGIGGLFGSGSLATSSAPFANTTNTMNDSGETAASGPSITNSAPLVNTTGNPPVTSDSGASIASGPLATTPVPTGITDSPSNLTDTGAIPTTSTSYTISAFAGGTGYLLGITNSIAIPLSTGFASATTPVNVNADSSTPADSTSAFPTSFLTTGAGLAGGTGVGLADGTGAGLAGGTGAGLAGDIGTGTGTGIGIGMPGITGIGTANPGDSSNFNPRADSNSSYTVGTPTPTAASTTSEGGVGYRVEWVVGVMGALAVVVGLWL